MGASKRHRLSVGIAVVGPHNDHLQGVRAALRGTPPTPTSRQTGTIAINYLALGAVIELALEYQAEERENGR